MCCECVCVSVYVCECICDDEGKEMIEHYLYNLIKFYRRVYLHFMYYFKDKKLDSKKFSDSKRGRRIKQGKLNFYILYDAKLKNY